MAETSALSRPLKLILKADYGKGRLLIRVDESAGELKHGDEVDITDKAAGFFAEMRYRRAEENERRDFEWVDLVMGRSR
jgi:hypothetical protein